MHIQKTLLASSLVLALAACTSTEKPTQAEPEMVKEEAMASVDMNNTDLYEVHEGGRLYVFDDAETYHEFLSVGETSFRQTFIGAGPQGQTVVYGMTAEDKSKPYNEIAGYNLYMGTLPAADDFYGEARLEGRIYVFDSIDDMKKVRETGEAALRYTDIGSGPKGETVIYVLRNDNKSEKPVALINEFKKRNPAM